MALTDEWEDNVKDAGMYGFDYTDAQYAGDIALIEAVCSNTLYWTGGAGNYQWYPSPVEDALRLVTTGHVTKGRLKVEGVTWTLADLPAGLAKSDTYVGTCWSRWLEMPDHQNLHRLTWNEGTIQWSVADGSPWKVSAGQVAFKIIDRLLAP